MQYGHAFFGGFIPFDGAKGGYLMAHITGTDNTNAFNIIYIHCFSFPTTSLKSTQRSYFRSCVKIPS
jgi:hypothetical protein